MLGKQNGEWSLRLVGLNPRSKMTTIKQRAIYLEINLKMAKESMAVEERHAFPSCCSI